MFSQKRLILYIVLLLVSIAFMVVLILHKTHVTSPRDYDAIAQEGVLRIVTDYNEPGYFISGDTTKGFQYELSKQIALFSGIEVHLFLETSLEKSFEGLKKNQYDIIARNIQTTATLKEQFTFVDPMLLNKQVLVQRTAKSNQMIPPIRNQLDLAGKTIVIPKNSPAMLRLLNLQEEIGDTIYIKEDELYSYEQLIFMVAKGNIDFAVCDQLIAETLKHRLPEIDIETDISFTQIQSWVIRKEAPQLLDSLNHWMQLIRERGIFKQIEEKYLP